LLLTILPGLSSCGFKLRGAVELPEVLQDTYIESKNPFTGMARALRVELESLGAHVVPQKELASAVLVVVNERSANRVLSVGSSGKASEYELFDEVTFALRDKEGQPLLAAQSLRTTRDLVFDETELLGTVSEGEGIHVQMRSNLARQIIMRIQAGMRAQ
jgi:LPS-assembly lipoprotein